MNLTRAPQFPPAMPYWGGASAALAVRPNVGEIANTFRQEVYKLADQHFPLDTKRLFFGPTELSSRSTKRLTCLGITGQWSAARTCPEWPDGLRQQVMAKLLLQSGSLKGSTLA